MNLKVYMAGPVTGRDPEETIALFDKYEAMIRECQFTPVNPLKLGCTGENWHNDMRLCIKALVDCNLIALLPGWQQSAGASLEEFIARSLNINTLNFVNHE